MKTPLKNVPIHTTRRSLLRGLAGLALTQLLSTLSACGGRGNGMGGMGTMNPTPLINPNLASARPLPIVPLATGTVDGTGTRRHSLSAQAGTSQLVSGVNTSTWGYNGALLGPALLLRQGEATALTVQNTLAETTTAHWHGLLVPADMDGGPHQEILAGSSWTAAFTVSNAPSTCWYHPHTHGATGRQVIQGLGGLLIIEDSASAQALLPHVWGVDDVALVFQDRRFNADGSIDYALTPADKGRGYQGDHLLVNGCHNPVWQAPQQWVRLRLLNACNARFLSLRLSNSATLHQIANEGGLLASPVARSSLMLAPGERAEVLVDLSGLSLGQSLSLNARSSGMMDSGSVEVSALFLSVSQAAQAGAITALPATLPATPTLSAPAGAIRRTFSLDSSMSGGMGGGMGSGGMGFTINGTPFNIARTDFSLTAGNTEVWTFTNTTGMGHPIHVHGVRMSLLSRNGAPVAAQEQGQRDTFVVDGNGSVDVVVQAPATASAMPFMLHCHILEHEDAGMMLQFVAA
ncbi:MAG: multicopper oxidase family protein [Leptothrix ochracea]|uniref:multicopper oxidase family protein n=1 Tax=Leptothrix ochracea TaxID=735331 RepID=UPI0034E264C2